MFDDPQVNPETLNKPETLNPARVAESDAWSAVMQNAPEMASETAVNEDTEQIESINDAAALVNYGVDALVREVGIQSVIDGIKSIDTTNSENPIGDLFEIVGIDTPGEVDDVRAEARAANPAVAEFREKNGLPITKRTPEGARHAIEAMKDLIAKVSTDPDYAKLRLEARAMGKGYFDCAVTGIEKPGLTDLFNVLKTYKETENQEPTEETEPSAPGETPKPGETPMPGAEQAPDEFGYEQVA